MLSIIEKHTRGTEEYVGIAADETSRLEKERKGFKLFLLAEWSMAEADCLQYCYDRGFTWEEYGGAGTVRLYDVLGRVPC